MRASLMPRELHDVAAEAARRRSSRPARARGGRRTAAPSGGSRGRRSSRARRAGAARRRSAMPWRRPSVAIEPSDLKRVGLRAPAQVAREPAGLAQRVLAGRRVELAGGGVRHGGDVAERVDAVQALRRGRARPPAPGRARRAAARAARRRGWRRRRPSRRRSRSRSGGRRTARRRCGRWTRARSRRGSPRRASPSVRAAKRARLSGTCPRMRGAESTKTQRGRTPARRGCRRSAPSASSCSSATASTPAKPAPAKTNVSRRSRARRVGVGELDLAQHVVAQADRVADVLEARARARRRPGTAACA